MATSLGDGTVAVVDLRTKRLVETLPARDGAVAEGLAFLPGGRRLATGGIGASVTVWDLRSRTVVRQLRFSEPVGATAVSRDGTMVAVQRQTSGGRDSHVEVRDLRSGGTLYTHTIRFGLGGLSFSGDGRMLVASGCCRGGSVVNGWDARSGAQRFHRTIAQKATAFALAPDSRTLAVGTGDGHVIVLDARSGAQRGQATTVAGSEVQQIAVSPDGRLLAVSPHNGGATLWDLRSRSRLGDEFPVSPGVIPQVAFEPNGRLLLTEFGSNIEWPTDRPTLQSFACQIAGRDLARDDWKDLLPTRAYRPVC